MKTNFNKLALQAGIGAAMVAGSMSANAVITAVPAPAQLVPLFYYNTTTGVDTAVRVIVPKSVGSDTVINILRGTSTLQPQDNWNSEQQFASSDAIHYWVMNTSSQEIYNDSVIVTPDQEWYFYATTLPGFTSAVGSGSPTYLLLTTEDAVNGGEPNFMFTAEAWLENNGNGGTYSGIASAVNIPVFGLADSADTVKFPTPGNNVVENWLTLGTGTGGPVASPIHTGIRTGGTGTGNNLRVVDVPLHASNSSSNPEAEKTTIVAWTDANSRYTTIGLYAVDSEENQQSRGSVSLPKQLNFLNIGYTAASGSTGASPIGVLDAYTTNLSNTGVSTGGFLKMVIPAVSVPTGATEAGAYSAIGIFTIPAAWTPGTAAARTTDGSEIALDTGWFNGQ